MVFLEVVYRVELFLQSIIRLILNLIEPCSEVFLDDGKIDPVDFLLHLYAYPLISFLVSALTYQFPNHFYLRHFAAIQLIQALLQQRHKQSAVDQ